MSPVTDHMDAILAALRTCPELRLAIVFGSMATGQVGPESDVDVAVDVGRPLSPEEKISLIDQLAMQTGRPVDLIDLKTVGQPLLSQIMKTGKRILGSTTEHAKLIYRNILDAEDFLPLQERILRERRKKWTGS